MKRFIYPIIALAAFVWAPEAAAIDEYVGIFINPIVVEVENGKGTVEVWYETDIPTLNAFDFRLYLPKGFDLAKNSRGSYEKFVINPDEDVVYNHSISAAGHLDAEEPYVTFVGLSTTNDYLGTGRHWLFSFNVTAPDDFTAANFPLGAEARIGNMTIASNSPSGVISYHPSTSFVFAPGNVLTGVENVSVEGNADNGEEEIYDLHGIRMQRPLQPGIYIINGEKVAVLK